jgi:hypothetical protein
LSGRLKEPMMNKNAWMAGLLVVACSGCSSIGNAPAPMDENQLKSAVEKLSPKDQIAYINSTPMPPDKKAARIKEIEEKTGYHPDAAGKPGPPDAAR